MKTEKKGVLILALILAVVVLLGAVLYLIVIRPAITGNAIRLQNEGVTYAVASIMQQVASCQPVPLTFEDQTINVIAIGCPGTEQIAAAMQQTQQPA